MKTDNSETNYILDATNNIDIDFYIRKARKERNEAIVEMSLNAIESVLGLGASVMALFRLPKVA